MYGNKLYWSVKLNFVLKLGFTFWKKLSRFLDNWDSVNQPGSLKYITWGWEFQVAGNSFQQIFQNGLDLPPRSCTLLSTS